MVWPETKWLWKSANLLAGRIGYGSAYTSRGSCYNACPLVIFLSGLNQKQLELALLLQPGKVGSLLSAQY